MKRFVLILSICLLAGAMPTIASTRAKHGRASSQPRLISGLGSLHHPVSTKNATAQEFFDQGLKLIYGFNHEEARRSFQRAAELDPKLAMAWWGVALAIGPNYNFPADPGREKAAHDAVQRAISLQENASEAERAYINALAFRYSNDPKSDLHQLDLTYRDAMAKLVRHYPDDLDAATLYADSAMNVHRWQLWLRGGQPNEGTEEIVSVLESVLDRNPDHLGANHFYIHAMEASTHPERALASAARLERLAPAAGHLLHMPSHIYARVGDFDAAARANAKALVADQKFIRSRQESGFQAVMLYLHDLHFLTYAYCMSGDFPGAKRAAERLVNEARPDLKQMPMMEGFVTALLSVLVTFERWKDILQLPAPDQSLLYLTGNWHFARGMAFAGLGRAREAQTEAKACFSAFARLPHDASFDSYNSVSDIARVQENLLAAMIQRADREHGEEGEGAEEALSHAIAAEDNLNYTEPPSWFPPTRPMLGRALLDEGKAAAAEKVFRNALEKTPRYFRALTGLRDSLKKQGRDYEAGLIEQQLHAQQNDQGAPVSR
ncbi:MAG: Tetratricopeptide 2 repeat protein [Spartobacteria bacterium]|nr:Tetratricopeptide 2 repeat protein [Spartobacteria bacterium]